jgi:hypothetical protein
MIHFLVPAAQEFAIRDYLNLYGQPLRQDIHILHYESLAQQRDFLTGTYVLAALDQLTPGTAQLLFEIHQKLEQVPGFRFLNHPRNTLQRFELLTELHHLGRNDFRAVRAGGDLKGLRFPVFLREERLHNGAISPLLSSEREINLAIGRALVQGYALNNLLIVEFCDTADDTGLYRKYAAFIVGRRVIARSLNYGRNWMLKHSETEFSLPMIAEELRYVLENPHQQELLKIFQLAQVEYGRIDYAIKNGKVQTWEINLHPTIGRGLRTRSKPLPPDLDAARDKVKSAFYEGFERAWREVDLPTNSDSAYQITLSPDVNRSLKQSHVPRGRILNAAKAVLRPAKPFITPLSSPFLYTLGRIALLFRRNRN